MCHAIAERRGTKDEGRPARRAGGRRRSALGVHRSSFRRGGFTLIELLIAAVVMTMTLAALAALTMAVADSWRAAEDPQSTRVHVVRGANRFLEMVRSAKYLGFAGRKADGSGAAVLLWEQDDDQPGTMQLSEVALLEHETGTRTLTLYRVPATAANAKWLCDIGDIDEEADAAAFKKAGNVMAQVVMHDVVAFDAWAHVDDAGKARPSLEYAMRVENGRDRSSSFETVTLRAPGARPVKCAGAASCACTAGGGCACASPKSCACDAATPCRSATAAGCCTLPKSEPSDATK